MPATSLAASSSSCIENYKFSSCSPTTCSSRIPRRVWGAVSAARGPMPFRSLSVYRVIASAFALPSDRTRLLPKCHCLDQTFLGHGVLQIKLLGPGVKNVSHIVPSGAHAATLLAMAEARKRDRPGDHLDQFSNNVFAVSLGILLVEGGWLAWSTSPYTTAFRVDG